MYLWLSEGWTLFEARSNSYSVSFGSLYKFLSFKHSEFPKPFLKCHQNKIKMRDHSLSCFGQGCALQRAGTVPIRGSLPLGNDHCKPVTDRKGRYLWLVRLLSGWYKAEFKLISLADLQKQRDKWCRDAVVVYDTRFYNQNVCLFYPCLISGPGLFLYTCTACRVFCDW